MILFKIIFALLTLVLIFKIYVKIRYTIAWYRLKKARIKHLKMKQENEQLKIENKKLLASLNFVE